MAEQHTKPVLGCGWMIDMRHVTPAFRAGHPRSYGNFESNRRDEAKAFARILEALSLSNAGLCWIRTNCVGLNCSARVRTHRMPYLRGELPPK